MVKFVFCLLLNVFFLIRVIRTIFSAAAGHPKRAIFRRYSDIKTSKELSNEMSLKYENFKRGRKSLDLDEHPFLCRKDSRKLYMDNDIDITDDIELEPGTTKFFFTERSALGNFFYNE